MMVKPREVVGLMWVVNVKRGAEGGRDEICSDWWLIVRWIDVLSN